MPDVSRVAGPSSGLREVWTAVVHLSPLLLGLAAGASVVLSPLEAWRIEHRVFARVILMFLCYGLTGLWASQQLLRRRLSRTGWGVVVALLALAFLLLRLLLLRMDPQLSYPLWVQAVLVMGVGLVGTTIAGLLGTAAERTSWAFGFGQLRRPPVFLFVTTAVAFVSLTQVWRFTAHFSSPRDEYWEAQWALVLLAIYSLVWSVAPAILRLVEVRPLVLGAITTLSILAAVALKFVPDTDVFIEDWLAVVRVCLGTVGVTGIALGIAALTIRATSYLGGILARLGVLGCVVALPIAWFEHVLRLFIARSGSAGFYLQALAYSCLLAPLAIVVPAVFIGRLSRDLSTARAQFRSIAAGELPRPAAVVGREESSRLLERLTDFSGQLSKRPFLEQLSADLRARADQLRMATRELNETNRQRVETERFAAVAGIVATASHELRNPVAQIAGHLPLVRSYVEATSRTLRNPEELGRDRAHRLARAAQLLSASGRDIEASARRASLVLGDLQTISATPLRALEEVDLRTVVERTIRLTPRDFSIQMQCELEAVPALTARAGEIEQVVANLIENALDAVVPGGMVTVRLRRMGNDALLQVEDDGHGMTQEVLAQATEPFFTTKPAGKGSGLGLAIASSIVRAHQGTLALQSREGVGTRVEVRLPFPEQARA